MLKLPQLSSTVSDPAVSAMAQVDSNIVQAAAEKIKEEQQRLKYLAFIQVASVSAALGFSNLYVYSKEKTGPLKPAVNIVEGIVSSVVRLVFDKYFDDPAQLLKLVNPNVGEFVTKIDGLDPPVIQQVSSKAISTAQKATGVAGNVFNEVQSAGVVSTAPRFINQVSSEAISAAQRAPGMAGGLPTEVQRAGVVGGFGTKITGLVPPAMQQVSPEAILVAQNAPGVVGGVATDVQRAGIVTTASGFINQVSSEATSAAKKAPEVAGGLANEAAGAIKEEQWLKYLAFVQVAAVHAILCFTNLFLYAKERSGALKPGIEFVEGITKNMFQLVFDRYFGDPKVGEFVSKIDGLVPPVIKQVSSEAFLAAQKAAGVAGAVSTEVQHPGAGLVSTASGFIKQVSPEAFSAVQKAPGVAEGLATEVERAGAVFNSATKIDSLVSPVFNQVSLEAISAAQNAPGVDGGVTTEVQHAGVLGTASGFIKQVSSEAISAAQKAPGVAGGVTTSLQHVGVVGEPVAEVDYLVPSVIKQVTSEAISAAQRAPGVAGGVATLLQHVGVVGEPVAEVDHLVPSVIKQVSSEAISTAQKAPAVAGGVATEVQRAGVASISPGFLRQVSFEAISAAQKAPGVSQGVATELRHAGVLNTASGFAKSVAKGLYAKYEPKAEQYAVSTWRKLNHLPLFPQVASVAVPTAAYFTNKYNQTVVSRAEKGYKVASYLPLVPTEKIAKVFSEEKLQS